MGIHSPSDQKYFSRFGKDKLLNLHDNFITYCYILGIFNVLHRCELTQNKRNLRTAQLGYHDQKRKNIDHFDVFCDGYDNYCTMLYIFLHKEKNERILD